MTDATTNKEGLTVRELGSDRVRCHTCGAYKDDTPGDWLIDSGVVACPDCKTDFTEADA